MEFHDYFESVLVSQPRGFTGSLSVRSRGGGGWRRACDGVSVYVVERAQVKSLARGPGTNDFWTIIHRYNATSTWSLLRLSTF